MKQSALDVITLLKKRYPNQTQFRRKLVHSASVELGHTSVREYADIITDQFKIRKGLYDYRTLLSDKPKENVQAPKGEAVMQLAAAIASISDESVYIPTSDPTFVKWGVYNDILDIVKAKVFYPVYISGLSGNGKTMMVEQACAQAGREFIRVQISPETDEDDLIGGFRLLNGETVFAKGPVVKAMERGAVLLIDEIDRSTNKIMCLQGVLEGKPVMIKKTGELIAPSPGFNVIATANTKGKGSSDGRFVAASIIDEAFLERFVITIEQPYASGATERKIVKRHLDKYDVSDDDFVERLCTWSEAIRKTFDDDGVDETISTRRLCHIAQTYSIFKDRLKAITLCVSRFDADTRTAFIDLYSKIDPSVNPNYAETPEVESDSDAAFTASF